MLTTIPEEIQETIVMQCAAIEPGSLASLARTNSRLRRLICQPEDQHLWRNVYMEAFDDPRYALSLYNGTPFESQTFDWKTRAQRIFRAAFRLRKAEISAKDIDYYFDEDASEAFLLVAHLARPCDSDVDIEPSKNEIWLNEALRGMDLPPPTNQSYARLNLLACFLSTANSVKQPWAAVRSCLPSRLVSRAFIYDLANYTEESSYGPWLPDGTMRVNWRHLWHAINVIRHNIQERSGWNITPGNKFTNFRANSAYTGDPEKEAKSPKMNDWAGVSGLYTRAICFMDHRELYAYNHSTLLDRRPLPTTIFEQEDFTEALNIVAAEFEVTSVDEVGPPEFPHRPTIHFRGRSGPLSDGGSSPHRIIRGTVSMTLDGQIRWSFVDGHEWSSEGIQLGGVKSAAGVVGTWTSPEHDDEAPVGPFWLWKTEHYRKAFHKVRANLPRTEGN